MGKYILEEYLYDRVIYNVISAKTLDNMFRPWKNRLSRNQKKCIRRYRNSVIPPRTSGKINKALREGNISGVYKKISDEISASFNNLEDELEENIIVYRCLSKSEYDWIKKYSIGDEFQILNFEGTHVKKTIKSSICKGYIFFLIPAFSRVAYINNLSYFFRNEKEMLIDKGQSYKLIEIRTVLGKNVFILKLLDTFDEE